MGRAAAGTPVADLDLDLDLDVILGQAGEIPSWNYGGQVGLNLCCAFGERALDIGGRLGGLRRFRVTASLGQQGRPQASVSILYTGKSERWTAWARKSAVAPKRQFYVRPTILD